MEQRDKEQSVEIKKKRPVFLTILCILSFLGIIIVIISSLMNILSPSGSQKMLEKMGPMANSILGSMDHEKYAYYNEINNYVSFIAAFVCFAGVLMMWKLKRAGYFIYALGEVTPPLMVFVLFSDFFSNPVLSLAFLVSAVLMSTAAIAFLIMYGVNLKHMS
jgi:hypothetical protein